MMSLNARYLICTRKLHAHTLLFYFIIVAAELARAFRSVHKSRNTQYINTHNNIKVLLYYDMRSERDAQTRIHCAHILCPIK